MTPLLCHLFSSSTPDELILERLISNGADMYAVYPSTKKSILLYVIENCSIEVLDAVLRTKYNVNKPETNGEAPIFSCLPLGIKINKLLSKCYIQLPSRSIFKFQRGFFTLYCYLV